MTVIQIPGRYMVDDPSGNFSAYYNVKEKQKRHQRRLLVSAWHNAKKNGCENNSHNHQNARSTRDMVK